MNREIKFRAWDTKLEEMIKDPYVEQHMQFAHLNELISAALTRYVLMQYTGLRDKNGKEIYEGDIIKTDYNGGFTGNIEYRLGEWLIMRGTADILADLHKYNWDIEVIGNIYENPELLAKGEDKQGKDID
mgnify:CR=1 FL=1